MNDVYKFLDENVDLDNGKWIILGISGGPDSMALLYVMNELRKERDFGIVCAHVNHNVRKESEEEKVMLENYCKENKIIFEYMKIENYSEDNFHNEARNIRYKYFEDLVKKYEASYLMTAHHGDDLIETVLMRIVRGSSLKGYSGFSKIVDKDYYKIVRPFVYLTKAELVDFVESKDIPYATDKSNFKDCYTRNRYRKEILPFLKNEDKNVHKKFLKFSEMLEEYNDYIERQIKDEFVKVFIDGFLNIEKFLKLEHLIQYKIINYILEQIYNDDLMVINDTHVELIYKLITSSKSSSIIHLPNNVIFEKSYGRVTFRIYEPQEKEYEVELNDIVNLPSGKKIVKIKETEDNSNNTIRINSDEVVLPLYVRTRKIADKIETKGMNGHKKVNTIFIDNKISIKDRSLWPVVCDAENNIIWVPGLKKSKFDKKIEEKYDIILQYI